MEDVASLVIGISEIWHRDPPAESPYGLFRCLPTCGTRGPGGKWEGFSGIGDDVDNVKSQ